MADSLQDLPSQYDHAGAQARWFNVWESRGYFHAEPGAKDAAGKLKPVYSIVIPPPNVTGALHLGHALNNTLQDILVRWKRMQGFNTLWMPGTDHAGIATQAVVERRLLEEQKLSRHDLGREGLVAKIWEWKEQYEKRIIGQLKQLGCSCDWARLRFTFDEQGERAVREFFFRLFSDGKIYRGKRLVNWDTYLQTAVSDDEVFHEVVKGSFWHFRYPVVKDGKWQKGEPEFVEIATTRPETMLGDTAVAVHPDPAQALDKFEAELREKLAAAPAKERPEIEAQIAAVGDRRKAILPGLIQLRDMAKRGVQLYLPLTEPPRFIPLILDEWAKPELGSGAVKITPAHDPNDYEVGQRHPEIGLPINIMKPDGTLADSVPEKYRGLTMKKARDEVVADMEAATHLGQRLYDPEKDREDREIDLAHSDRSKTPIEPYLADQWFVKMDELAQSAMDAVSDGRVHITPERYAKSYLDWLGEKRDWPVGRQLWWGHRVPIWHVQVKDGNQDLDLQSDEQIASSLREHAEGATLDLAAALTLLDVQEDTDFTIVASIGNRSCQSTLLVCTLNERADSAMEQLRTDIAYSNVTGRRVRKYDSLTLESSIDAPSRDEEVLDTWFSSALWPMSTMGWPSETPELATFYPTSALVTSRDIITLWVARMVLAGLYNMQASRGSEDAVPFHEVFITPKILDGFGETMSKSKGNGVDPIDVIDNFGADALRYGIAHLTTDTQDVRMPVEFECPRCQHLIPQTKKNRTLPRIECDKCKEPFSTQWAEKPEDKALPRAGVVNERFELGRRFANKVWNASRFSLMNLADFGVAGVESASPQGPKSRAGGGASADPSHPIANEELLLEDRWILSRLATVTRDVTEQLESYRFSDIARTLYAFAWNDFCDYYVEIAKARFAHAAQKPLAQRVLAHVLDSLVRLLHPIMPFLAEEVWQLLNQVAPTRGLPTAAKKEESVVVAAWPMVDGARIDPTIETQFADFQAVLGAVRELRMAQNIPPREAVEFAVKCDDATAKLLAPMQPYFTQIARATATAIGPKAAAPEVAASTQITGALGPIEIHVDVSRFIDVDAEKARLKKELDQRRNFVKALEGKLANETFVSRAPADVVQKERDKLTEVRGQIAAAEAALAKLG